MDIEFKSWEEVRPRVIFDSEICVRAFNAEGPFPTHRPLPYNNIIKQPPPAQMKWQARMERALFRHEWRWIVGILAAEYFNLVMHNLIYWYVCFVGFPSRYCGRTGRRTALIHQSDPIRRNLVHPLFQPSLLHRIEGQVWKKSGVPPPLMDAGIMLFAGRLGDADWLPGLFLYFLIAMGALWMYMCGTAVWCCRPKSSIIRCSTAQPHQSTSNHDQLQSWRCAWAGSCSTTCPGAARRWSSTSGRPRGPR